VVIFYSGSFYFLRTLLPVLALLTSSITRLLVVSRLRSSLGTLRDKRKSIVIIDYRRRSSATDEGAKRNKKLEPFEMDLGSTLASYSQNTDGKISCLWL
jgi:hypothetical protein